MSKLSFKLEAVANGSQARAARFRTLHNEVLTPLFMPVGTQATVKGLVSEELQTTGSQILLANTYHLLLRPGPEVFQRAGGIQKFMNWPRSVLTDSGGFQIFSLPNDRRITEAGAEFRSYVDGKRILLSPELSIGTQKAIGSDIMMVLDECVPSTSTHAVAAAAMELTHRWALRSLAARGESSQAMFGIVQGACYEDLRRQSAAFLTSQAFDGFAIGGLAVGETKDEREHFTAYVTALLPTHLPRYLMGVGTPLDLLEAVHRGVDMFDCIMPSSHAQQGTAFTAKGIFRFRRGVYKFDQGPIDPDCRCHTCQHYTRSYLHHLVKADEGLGWRLIAHHNVHFYHQLMREMRAAILNDSFLAYYQQRRPVLARFDQENPSKVVAKPVVKTAAKPPRLGNYEIRVQATGAVMMQVSSREVMHPVTDDYVSSEVETRGGPDTEAEELYILQSHLIERLTNKPAPTPLVIWDVGLGAAHNAMAAIRAIEASAASLQQSVHLISFENDLDSLRLALKHPKYFKHLRHAAPHRLLADRIWESKLAPLRWELHEGDFLHTYHMTPVPDLVFFDPFSYKTDGDLWSLESFSRIARHCQGQAVELLTYSTSTRVRAAMLAAGFFVAMGKGLGKRSACTIALSPEAWAAVMDQERNNRELVGLDQRWLERWERSSARYPVGLCEKSMPQQAFDTIIRRHPQFASV